MSTSRGGVGDSNDGDTQRSPNPLLPATQTLRAAGSQGPKREARYWEWVSAAPRGKQLERRAGADPRTARTASLPALSPGAPAAAPGPGGSREGRGLRGPRPTRRRPPAGGCSSGPPRRPGDTYLAEARRGRPARPTSDSGLASRPGRGRRRYLRGGRGRGAVTSRGAGPRHGHAHGRSPPPLALVPAALCGALALGADPLPRKPYSVRWLTPSTSSSSLLTPGIASLFK